MKNLIKQTLERDFDLRQYAEFVKNFFNEIQVQPQEIKVPDSSQEFIKKITFLSDFSDTQKKTIDIYAVELVGGTKVERARSFQRNLISKLLKDNTKDAGLVAFYSKDNPDWRLSFIKLDYKLTDKGVKVEVGTPPKRYSFLVGKTEPSHTAQKQLLPILGDHKNNPLLTDMEEAFSVEKVTKEFYERYRKLFEDLSKDLKKNKAFQIIAEKENIDIDNFAKKLLGQIVFLYFLQKKGWLGVPQDKTWGQGDKFFLRTLFNKAKAEKQDFYDHYLEHLFYDTLNNPRRDEVDPVYSRYFDCKIPFLNGGLFEPDYDWKNTIVYLGNETFEEIIDAFDLYNFTVKEDEPLEKEVAVDPEMLGKVFENLLPENMRKGQGAYYTPREIVHYMCQESLINHLNTETKLDAERIRKLIAFKDEDLVNGNGSRKKALGFSDGEAQSLDRALANIKVCDPACGSGAFLVGMLNEIVSARRILEPRLEYKLKKETIQECIYGVDIDPGAVDIAKLRLWLSLVVDFELRDIEPLPNLDYKIMCGNSLLEELIVGDESIKLFDERFLDEKLTDNILVSNRNEEIEKQIKEKERELQKIKSFDAKLTGESIRRAKEIEKDIKALKKSILVKLSGDKHTQDDFYKQKGHYFEDLRILHKQYFTEYDPMRKKEKREQIEAIEFEFIKSSVKEKVNEFDSRISNLNMQNPGDRKKQAVLMKKKLEYSAIPEQIRNSRTRPYFLWKLNFFEVFQEKGGFDVVIANPPYVRVDEIDAQEREKFKLFFITATGKYDLYYLFFEKALSICGLTSSCVFISPNKFCAADSAKNLRKLFFSIITSGDILSTSRLKVFDSVSNYPIISIFKNGKCFKSEFMVKQAQDINSLMTLDRSSGYISNIEKLKDFPDSIIPININQESFNLIQRLFINSVPLSLFLSISEGLRIPVKYESESKQDFEIVKQYQFSKWSSMYTGSFISSSNLKKVISKDTDRYKKILQEKIVIAEDALEINATIDQQKRIPQGGVYFAVSLKNNPGLEYLLGLLNSKLFSWMYKVMYSGMHMGGGYLRYRSKFLENLPLPQSLLKLSKKDQRFIIERVAEILIICKSDKDQEGRGNISNIREQERQIDQMVYELYGLTKNEVEIIESSNKNI